MDRRGGSLFGGLGRRLRGIGSRFFCRLGGGGSCTHGGLRGLLSGLGHLFGSGPGGSGQLVQAADAGAGGGQRLGVGKALHIREGPQQAAGAHLIHADVTQLGAHFVGAQQHFQLQLGGVLAAFQLGQGQLQLLLVQNGIGGHGADAQHSGQLVAGHTQAGAHLVDLLQLFVQAGGGGCGDDEVDHKQRQHGGFGGHQNLHGQWAAGLGQRRVHHLDHDNTAQAPQQRELRADVAADVELHVGVVPPTDMVNFEQRPAAHQLDGGGEHHAHEEHRHGADAFALAGGGQRGHRPVQHHHAAAVNGADGAAEEPAVDKPPLLDGGVDDLDAPADTAVEEEPIQRLYDK